MLLGEKDASSQRVVLRWIIRSEADNDKQDLANEAGANSALEDNRLKIRVKEKPAATRQRSLGLPWLLLSSGFIALSGIGAVVFSGSDKPPAKKTEAPFSEKPSTKVAEPAVQSATFADDGESLWVSPTAGEPVDLGYLLPGTQLVLHVRVADLLAHAEGEKTLAALGPWGEQVVERLTESAGVALSEIETLLLGVRLGRDGRLQYACRLRLLRAKTQAKLAGRDGAGHVCFSSDRSNEKLWVVCSAEAVQELKSAAGASPLFARELQRVLQRTDEQRMVTLAFAGKFLQISGEKFLQGTSEPLREALVDFLGDEATATTLSLHWDADFFLELQSTVALNTRPHRFAALLEKRIAASSDRVEDVVLAEPLHPYGRKVLARFPAMLRKLGNYTRSAEVEKLSVLRCYLPVRAGHNLLTSTELLLNTIPASRGVPAHGPLTTSPPAKPQAIGQRLLRTTSLVFPKETLQAALEILSEDIGVPLKIAGRDLQLEGITKNQSFGIDLRNRPAAEILLAILLQANPDRTASGPTDVKQKLVYVVRQGEIRGEGDPPGEIVVTTRSAAARRGEKLPAVFEPASP